MDSDDITLVDGETILWTGRPQGGIILRPIEVFLIPFSLLWGGFAIFWNVTTWRTSADITFKLFGLPFAIMGVYIIFGRFFVDASLRKAIRYYVTNQRVVIVKGRGRSSVKSLDIQRLPMIEVQERSDGFGTLRFGEGSSLFAMNGFGPWQPTFDTTPQFLRVPNVRQVYELIRREADSRFARN